MNKGLIIYRNESYILSDYIKRELKKKYKDRNIIITLDIENELLKGFNISIIDRPFKYSNYFKISSYNNTSELINSIFKVFSYLIAS